MNLIRSFLSKIQKASGPFGPLANPLGKVTQPEPRGLKAVRAVMLFPVSSGLGIPESIRQEQSSEDGTEPLIFCGLVCKAAAFTALSLLALTRFVISECTGGLLAAFLIPHCPKISPVPLLA